ncbi:universal stress protein [Halobiforma nitratireducens]|nr:universal stress protein [Halobiforma nitratireducens]
MYDTILVATDGSDPGYRAGEHAIDLAEQFDAEFHAVYVVDTRRYGGSILTGPSDVVAELEQRGEEILSDLDARSTVDVTETIREGRPHEEIGNYAEEVDADLILLGNRGLGAAGEIGSVAERVVRYVDRPVMTA